MVKIQIRAARVNAGLTQVDAAKLLDISVNTLIKWESRPELIPAYKQRAISETYQIPIDNLIFLPNDQSTIARTRNACMAGRVRVDKRGNAVAVYERPASEIELERNVNDRRKQNPRTNGREVHVKQTG